MHDDIRAQLDAAPLRLVVPPPLRDAFLAWRLRDLERYLRIAALPLILVTVTLTLASNRFFTGELDARDTRLWTLGSAFACSAIIGGLLLIQLPLLRRHYPPLATLLSILLLAKFTAMPQLLSAPVAVAAEAAFCMIMIVITCLALRFTLARALVACLAGGGLGIALAALAGERPLDWRGLAYYFFAMAGVCLFVLWLVEERAKMAFLQSVLLDADRQELDALNRELSRLATSDALTGLANRRHFDATLAAEWERLQRAQLPLAVLFVDVDHFKPYNDHYGHGAGDVALAAVAGAVRAALRRPADLAARYGGEEFVVLLPETDADGARDVALRVLAAVDALALPHAASPTAPTVTASIGVASRLPGPGQDAAALLAAADAALYAAKHAGRHRVEVAA